MFILIFFEIHFIFILLLFVLIKLCLHVSSLPQKRWNFPTDILDLKRALQIFEGIDMIW